MRINQSINQNYTVSRNSRQSDVNFGKLKITGSAKDELDQMGSFLKEAIVKLAKSEEKNDKFTL